MPAASDLVQDVRRVLSGRGVATSVDLQSELKASQASVSRAIAAMRGEVLFMGRGPSTRYALLREVPRVGSRIGVFSVSSAARAKREGELTALVGGRFWFQSADGPGGLFEGLPWFVSDQRPEGFLGRARVRTHPEEGLPTRLSDWNDDQVLYAITTYGGSAKGDLVFGDRMLEAAQRDPRASTVATRDRLDQYAELAGRAAAGDVAGSSAGGEQPKFEALRADGEAVVPVIVKFSPALETPAGRRWADLLLLEHLANDVLRERGIPASVSEYLAGDVRAFLEVTRFDRRGTRGRERVFSLGSVDDEFVGSRVSFTQTARQLVEQGRLDRDSLAAIAFAEAFGRLIANSDMHFGNLSLRAEGLLDPRFSLAPVYDMSPMRYAPTLEVADPAPDFEIPPAPAHLLDGWADALDAAGDYWARAARLPRISEPMRTIADRNARTIRA